MVPSDSSYISTKAKAGVLNTFDEMELASLTKQRRSTDLIPKSPERLPSWPTLIMPMFWAFC